LQEQGQPVPPVLEPPRRQQPRLNQLGPPLPVLLRPVLLQPPPPCDDDARDDAGRSTSSSTRSLPLDPQPPSHRWPPALRGSLPPEPGPPPARTSDLPLQREPPHHLRGSLR
jgi:hypothetical protein